MNKLMVTGFILLAGSLAVCAQDSTVINKNIVVYRDTDITQLVNKYNEYNRTYRFVDGYRVQIKYSNVRDEIYQSKARIYDEFPELPAYVEYEQPNYKLRIGDFKTRLEATYYLQQIISIYPEAFIVRDRIKQK